MINTMIVTSKFKPSSYTYPHIYTGIQTKNPELTTEDNMVKIFILIVFTTLIMHCYGMQL